LGTRKPNQIYIDEEGNRRLNLGIACYHSVQNLLSFRVSETLEIEVYKTDFTRGFLWA
jgi:hypothetical protein